VGIVEQSWTGTVQDLDTEPTTTAVDSATYSQFLETKHLEYNDLPNFHCCLKKVVDAVGTRAHGKGLLQSRALHDNDLNMGLGSPKDEVAFNSEHKVARAWNSPYTC
jgi:hypothetical protein